MPQTPHIERHFMGSDTHETDDLSDGESREVYYLDLIQAAGN
ncbi:MAG: hypothetical protein U0V70_10320 [Terriglobia bacterium]